MPQADAGSAWLCQELLAAPIRATVVLTIDHAAENGVQVGRLAGGGWDEKTGDATHSWLLQASYSG